MALCSVDDRSDNMQNRLFLVLPIVSDINGQSRWAHRNLEFLSRLAWRSKDGES